MAITQQPNHSLPSELKFMVSRDTAADIRQWARRELSPDPHAADNAGDGYHTTSLYFDTDEFDTFFGRFSYARAKYRIRRYNDSEVVFLERKLKINGCVAKRRSEIASVDLRPDAGGTCNEQWFWRRLQHRRLGPVCQVAYDRMARVGDSPTGTLRLTIDQEITAAPVNSVAFTKSPGVELLSGRAILELKYRTYLPVLFKRLIQEFSLQSSSVSKYRLAVQTMELAEGQKGMVLHA